MKIKVNPAAYEKQFKIQSLEAENSNLKTQINDLKQANESFQKSIISKSTAISQFKKRIEVSKVQKQILEEDQNRKQKLVNHLQKQVGQLLTTADEYKNKKQRYLSEIAELQLKMVREDQSLKKQQQKLSITDKRIDEQQNCIQKMRMRNKQVEEEIKRLRETVMSKEEQICNLNNQVCKPRKEAK